MDGDALMGTKVVGALKFEGLSDRILSFSWGQLWSHHLKNLMLGSFESD